MEDQILLKSVTNATVENAKSNQSTQLKNSEPNEISTTKSSSGPTNNNSSIKNGFLSYLNPLSYLPKPNSKAPAKSPASKGSSTSSHTDKKETNKETNNELFFVSANVIEGTEISLTDIDKEYIQNKNTSLQMNTTNASSIISSDSLNQQHKELHKEELNKKKSEELNEENSQIKINPTLPVLPSTVSNSDAQKELSISFDEMGSYLSFDSFSAPISPGRLQFDSSPEGSPFGNIYPSKKVNVSPNTKHDSSPIIDSPVIIASQTSPIVITSNSPIVTSASSSPIVTLGNSPSVATSCKTSNKNITGFRRGWPSVTEKNTTRSKTEKSKTETKPIPIKNASQTTDGISKAVSTPPSPYLLLSQQSQQSKQKNPTVKVEQQLSSTPKDKSLRHRTVGKILNVHTRKI